MVVAEEDAEKRGNGEAKSDSQLTYKGILARPDGTTPVSDSFKGRSLKMLRAAIYCRCSTEEESQVDALKNQVAESETCVQEQGWFLIERYVESNSGTTTKGRTEYNRLFDDLVLDKFDVIVIKSQDRLMRNVKDWYLFLDRLLTNGKRLFMYIERKFYSADDALITGIKAILAEEYSRELSKKINNSHRRRQKCGGKVMLTSRVFGFEKRPDMAAAGPPRFC